MTMESLAAYCRAWARHQVFIAPASADAAARSGLTAAACRRIFGAPGMNIPLTGAWTVPAASAGTVVVEDPTLVYRFSHGDPDVARRGEVNPEFLNPHRLADRLLPVLNALQDRVRLVVLRPAPVYRTEALSFAEALERLDRFLALLPRPCTYALEPASASWLRPAYFACLRARGVVHVFSEGDRLFRALPPPLEQLEMPGAFAPPVCVFRSMAAPVPEAPSPATVRHDAWAEVMRRCLAAAMPLHLLIDDETDLLRALARLMHMMNDDLARRSVLRRHAA